MDRKWTRPPDRSLDTYDQNAYNANRLQRRFRRLQAAILFAGVLVVLAVAIQSQVGFAALRLGAELARPDAPPDPAALAHLYRLRAAAAALNWIVFSSAPRSSPALIAAAHSFRPGDKWVVLRGSAEAVKRQIVRFPPVRARYAPGAPGEATVERRFFLQLSAINVRLKQSDVSKAALACSPASSPAADERMSRSMRRVLKRRVDDQLGFFSSRTVRFDRDISWSTIAILAFGAIGTAAGGGQSLAVGPGGDDRRGGVDHLPPIHPERRDADHLQPGADGSEKHPRLVEATDARGAAGSTEFQLLVDLTEKALEEETASWSQRMTDAMAKLNRKAAGEGKNQGVIPAPGRLTAPLTTRRRAGISRAHSR